MGLFVPTAVVMITIPGPSLPPSQSPRKGLEITGNRTCSQRRLSEQMSDWISVLPQNVGPDRLLGNLTQLQAGFQRETAKFSLKYGNGHSLWP